MLLSIEDYRRLAGEGRDLLDVLFMEWVADIDRKVGVLAGARTEAVASTG